MRKLGDISYSLYLWHFPLLRLAEGVEGSPALVGGAKATALLGAVTISLACKRFVEDPFRHFYRREQNSSRSVVYWALAVLSVTLATGFFSERQISTRFNQELDIKYVVYKNARGDLARVYGHSCYQDYEGEKAEACVLGDRDGKRRVALVGDSHAVHWAPALEILATEYSIRLELYGKAACGFADIALLRSGRAPYSTCSTWRQAVLKRLQEDPPDLLLFSQARRQATSAGISHEDIVAGIGRTLNQRRPLGVTVVLLADTPRPIADVPKCLLHRLEPKACAFSITDGQRDKDAIFTYAHSNRFPLVDLSSVICPAGSCPAVVGTTVVWRDAHHMTASFAETLAEPLKHQIEKNGWIF